jgi:hypothetical protein
MGLEPEHIIDAVNAGTLKDKTVAGVALQVARMLKHMRLAIVSTGLTAAQVEAQGFAYFDHVQDAVDDALAQAGSHAKFGVITHGRYTYPIQQ